MNECRDDAVREGDAAAEPAQSPPKEQREASSSMHHGPSVLPLDAATKEAVTQLLPSLVNTSNGLGEDMSAAEDKAETGVQPHSPDFREEELRAQEPAVPFSHHASLSQSNLSTPREESGSTNINGNAISAQKDAAFVSHATLTTATGMPAAATKVPHSPSPSSRPSSLPPKEPTPLPSPPSLTTPPAATSLLHPRTGAVTSAPLSPSVPSSTLVTPTEASIRRWKESKDYLKLQQGLSKVLSSMNRTPLTDWAAQAHLLTQLHKTLKTFKDVVGAVELPDGERLARSLWRALSPQNVVGVQRKALEVLQTYFDFVDPAYPMTKDLPLFLPALLELLPQSTMQVKIGIFELLDGAVVRRMPPAALRSCAQGLFVSLLSCLEESETSLMYRRAMALLEYVHATLKREDTAPAAARRIQSTPLHAADLRGGQVLPAYAWVLIRDAATLRSPALSVMKGFIAQADVPTTIYPIMCAESDGSVDVMGKSPPSPQEQQSLQPNWVGGDAQTVVSALLNSLQDTQEKTHRLALDVLALICPLNGVGGCGLECNGHAGIGAAATAFSYESTAGGFRVRSPTSSAGAPQLSGRQDANAAAAWTSESAPCPCCVTGAHQELFSFEVKSLLVAAAAQLLGTRYGTPSVRRRIFHWLAVDPGFDVSHHSNLEDGHGPFSSGDYNAEGATDIAAVGGASAASSSSAYVHDVTSCILSRGFHMVVQHWQATWTGRPDESRDSGCSKHPPARQWVDSELSALQNTARALLYSAAPRPSTAPSASAALGGGGGGENSGRNNTALSVPAPTSAAAAAALATPLVWLRVWMVLFRYRSPSFTDIGAGEGGEENSVSAGSPVASDAPRFYALEGAAKPDATLPFLLHVAPLVLPFLGRLLMEVPSVLSQLSLRSPMCRRLSGSSSSGGIGGSPEEAMWTAEVRAMLRVIPWTSFVQLDVAAAQAVRNLIRHVLTRAPHIALEEGADPAETPNSRTSFNAAKEGCTEHLRRRVQCHIDEAFAVADVLKPLLIDASADQPLAAQKYLGDAMDWFGGVMRLLGEVVEVLAEMLQKRELDEEGKSRLPLLVSAANGLLRLMTQRIQQLTEPMLDRIFSTATMAEAAAAGADFFAPFLSAVDTQVLRPLRQATLYMTSFIVVSRTRGAGKSENQNDAPPFLRLPASGALMEVYAAEVQKLLSRMHYTTLHFTCFLTQLHVRCQQQSAIGVLLDCASEDGVGAREGGLARQTTAWLTSLCEAATEAAGSAGAPLFFTRAVRLLLDVLFRTQGRLLPGPVYYVLEPSYPASGDVAEAVAFTERFVLAPIVRCLWEGCGGRGSDAATALLSPPAARASMLTRLSPDTVAASYELLLALISISPACARCLDVFILRASQDVAVVRLVELHGYLTQIRARQRRRRYISAAVPELTALPELHDPGMLFLGLLTILDCLSGGAGDAGDISNANRSLALSLQCDAAEPMRQLARAYLSQALLQDSPNVLLPLFFSFLCPLVLPSASTMPHKNNGGEGGAGGLAGGASLLHSASAPTSSSLPLTLLLPTTLRSSTASSTSRLEGERVIRGSAKDVDEVPIRVPARSYRYLEAPELVRYLSALLQLPNSTEWVCQLMQIPTPNSLRVLLRGLEAQSFMTPEDRAGNSGSTASAWRSTASAASSTREGPSETLFAATALLLLSLSRQTLLSLHWSRIQLHQANSSASLDSPTHAEPPEHQRCSILLDSLACLNRLLELSQTGPRVQPHRTAVLTWQFTSAQLLPLLQLAVQAGLNAAQAMLLNHISGVVMYLDDAVSSAVAYSDAGEKTAGGQAVADAAFASRHWRHHALLRVGVAAAGRPGGLLRGGVHLPETHREANGCSVNGAGDVGANGEWQTGGLKTNSTPVLDDLQRAPPAVLSNKLLYAMIGEAVAHVLSNLHEAQGGAKVWDASSCAHEVDTLVLWLNFYCEIMPYSYRDLVPSVEVVVDVLLSALETTTLEAGDLLSASALTAVYARVHCACYATLAYIVRFLFSVARAADVESYETAVKAKESMSWIASTFSQEDPVAQARNTTMWMRSPVLAPIRAILNRLVGVSMRTLYISNAPHSTATALSTTLNGQHTMWGCNTAEDDGVTMDWGDRSSAAEQQQSAPAADLREHSRGLLQLLSRSAGPQFLITLANSWCGTYAAHSSLWMFETAAQRQCRLSQQEKLRSGYNAVKKSGKQDDTQIFLAAWDAKDKALQAAHVLQEDVGVSVIDVMAAVALLLRDTPSVQRSAEQQQPKEASAGASNHEDGKGDFSLASRSSLSPLQVTQILFFLNQLVEAACVTQQGGGLTERAAEATLAVMASVVSQWPPEPLSFCCILHTMYCLVAYANDEPTAVEAENGSAVGSIASLGKARAPAPPITKIKVYQNRDYLFTLCRLLEGLSVNPAMTHRSATLMLLQLLCSTLHAVMPSSLSAADNPGRVVDAATRVFQRALLPVLRRGIASVSEAEILMSAPLVAASLRVLRAMICGFAPDLTFQKRVQRDVATVFFSEHFFRYTRGALHEWTLLLRQMCTMDEEFHSLLCERMVPSPGRLSVMMMSREAEALQRERAMKGLAFFICAIVAPEDAVTALTAAPSALKASVSALASVGAGSTTTVFSPAIPAIRQKELILRIREQLTDTLQRFSSPATPTAAQIEKKEVFVQPLRAAFLVFRVLLMINAPESLVASLWPLVWPELIRALSIVTHEACSSARGEGAAREAPCVSVEAEQEILKLQMEALKVLDVDYTLNPAHALAFRWLFADDAALTNLMALQQQQIHSRRQSESTAPHTPSPFELLSRDSTMRRPPLVSHLEVLHLLKKTPLAPSNVHFSPSAVISTIHESQAKAARQESSALYCTNESFAPVLSTIQRCWPLCARPSASDSGLRRPLYNIPSTHYLRLDSIHCAAEAFTVLLQRVNRDALPCAASGELGDVQSLVRLQTGLNECVGHHSEVCVAYMQDLVEADLTTTDPDTML
ncbi:hypothetical protein ABL78_5715 [Leptomonas seymouri]|uniref:DOP1 N-terminal domain-containing protein n=1 Tax=Leptomonas seymouri TaxID=5684 RepID=A0A0N1HWG9_LEPSE|nr:hypothetical protein ABL78_5715 [Leptomonas seymouri]|eukprot:KPI85232.1 hypothetical protein ABL78_5715 [Leptomonas seymouri]